MEKYINSSFQVLPTAQQLRAELNANENTEVRAQISQLFDAGTFVELAAFTKRGVSDFLISEKSSEFESVICGYGAIDGKLTFAFAEDSSRMGGAIDDRHAKKICDLYSLAMKNGAPIIGIFNSNGVDIFDGTVALSAYGRIISAVSKASGVIPQIAFVAGKCLGTSAAIASMFDVLVKSNTAQLYVSSPALIGCEDCQSATVAYEADVTSAIKYIRSLIGFLPSNSSVGVQASDICTDNLNRMLGNLDFGGSAISAISMVVDNSMYTELSANVAKEVSTVFATVGGVKCGIVATSYAENEGRITARGARKISRFVNLCDSFSIPLVTLCDSRGLAVDKENEDLFAPELAKLAMAYASSSCVKVTVVMGHAIGASFVLLGSKSLGADIVYALDNSEIGALCAESAVAFAWEKFIDEQTTRDELVNTWKTTVSSPAYAAAGGEIDDIISTNELRARICSALLMLSQKGYAASIAKSRVLPL